MAARLSRMNAKDSVEDLVAAIERDGGVIVEDLLDAGVMGCVNQEIAAWLDATPDSPPVLNEGVRWFMGQKTRHFTGLCAKSRTFATKVMTHDVLCAIADRILLPNCVRYQLNIAHVLDRGPGSDQQMLHRDEVVWSQLPRPHPEVQLASVIALCDFTAENGATRVVPGSHRWESDRVAKAEEIAVAEMPAGAGVIYLGSTIHGGGPNSTADERRVGFHLSYTMGWLRTEENHYLSTPLEVARTLPRRSQELLGYAAHDALAVGGGYLGTVDTQDPVELIAEGRL